MYNIQDGAVLLAPLSWHLYPDMVTIGPSVRTSKNIPRGQIDCSWRTNHTTGLQNSTPSADGGLRWSLSLAHLRYYGDSTVLERSAGINTPRVFFKQFTLAVLGNIISAWGLSKDNTESF